MKKPSADFPKIVVDQNAETRAELLAQWPKCDSSLGKFIVAKVKAGEWERVMKRTSDGLRPAYRRATKPNQ